MSRLRSSASDRRADAPPVPETVPGQARTATDTAASASVEDAAADTRRRLPRAFAAFEFVPFRWYMGAIVWFNAAMATQMLVRGYLTYDLTGSFGSLGVVSLTNAVPMLLMTPLGGVIADRQSRRAVLQFGQVAAGAFSAVVAVLLFTGRLEFWHLLVTAGAQGAVNALVLPSRQALLPEVVGMARLMNAIPLQTAGMNLMQILAPAAGGFMIDLFGAGWVYVAMTAMYAMSVVMLFLVQTLTPDEMRASRVAASPTDESEEEDPSAQPAEKRRGTNLKELASGFVYLRNDRTMLSIMAFTFLASILGMPIMMLLPGYVGAVFGDKGATLGMLQMAMGIGALVGALGLASMQLSRHRGLILAGSSAVLGIALIAFSLTNVFLLAWLGLFVVGIGSAGRMALSQGLVQGYVQDSYRGRVMAIYMLQFSLMAIGSFGVGLYMEAVGPELAIRALGAVLVVATALFVVLVPRFRNVD